jgi:hypothetical protein
MDNLARLHVAEDDYTEAYKNRASDLNEYYLSYMNQLRRNLNMTELLSYNASYVANFISSQPNQTRIVIQRAIWATTYPPINSSSTDTLDDDKVIMNTECGICLDEFTQTSIICSPNVCEHGFHCRCIRQNRNKKCPLCRKDYTHLVISSYNLKPPSSSFGERRCSSVAGDISYLRGL